MIPVLVTAPTEAPVTLDEAKDHLRVTHSNEDALILGLIAAATGQLDGWRGQLGRAIMPQTWAQEWVGEVAPFTLSMPDASNLVVTADGVPVTTFTTAESPVGMLVDDVAGQRVRIQYRCGMAAAQLAAARQAILLIVAHWYANREAVGEDLRIIPLAFDGLLDVLRWRSV